MKPHIQTDFKSAEELIRQLEVQRITRGRFSVDLPVDDIRQLIRAFYRIEVEKRGHEAVYDEGLETIFREVASWLADPYGKPGLMLQGLYGNGKTTLLYAIVNAVNRLYYHPETEKRIAFTVADARKIARIAMKPLDKAEAEFNRLCGLSFLAIDDLGEEPMEVINYGMVHTPVKDLLLARYKRNQAMTIVTTNLVNSAKKKELTEHYGERVVDRFREMMKIIVFRNGSYRK